MPVKLIAPPHTPFNSNGRLNLDVVPRQAEYFQAAGVSGVFICGSTGEGQSLTADERMELAERWVSVAKDAKLQVIVQVGHIRYFDGSEELYDQRDDPREWFNVANRDEHTRLKRKLASHIPKGKRLTQFVRWGRWKCVFPVDGKPMLFEYHSEFGISEQNDLAAEHSEGVAAIQEYLVENNITARRVNMPENPRHNDE